MPIWLVIIIAGCTCCTFLFLKAREIEKAAPFKKIKQGNITVKKKAKAVAARPSTMPVIMPNTSGEEVYMSKDVPSRVASEIEAIQKAKEVG